MDGETVAEVEAYGVERWIGELSRDLRDGTYRPSAVRRVLVPKKQPGKFRPLGIPCLRDRVAQTLAMLVLMPVFEADLEPEQYGYRPGRSAKDADDFRVLGKAPAAVMLAAVVRLMERLKLPVNARKTRCLRCPENPIEFLGYRIGWNYRPTDGSRYIGTRPSKASVQSISRRISEQTDRKCVGWSAEEVVERLNRMLAGWANYFTLGQVSPAYKAVDRHATRRLRRWFRRKHKVRSGGYVRFPDDWLWDDCGLVRLGPTTGDLPWAKA